MFNMPFEVKGLCTSQYHWHISDILYVSLTYFSCYTLVYVGDFEIVKHISGTKPRCYLLFKNKYISSYLNLHLESRTFLYSLILSVYIQKAIEFKATVLIMLCNPISLCSLIIIFLAQGKNYISLILELKHIHSLVILFCWHLSIPIKYSTLLKLAA